MICEQPKSTQDQPKQAPESMVSLIESKFADLAFDKPLLALSEPGTYYGFTAGACTGFALKKVAKAAAFTFGAVFLGFQVAAQTGYVTVNWPKVETDIRRFLPERPHDDSAVVNDAVQFLTTNTGIAATVFTAGFMTGLKLG